MIKNSTLHYSSESDIIRFQEERLKETLEYLSQNSPFYKRMFKENNIDISQIKHLSDLQKLPVTTKEDLQKRNNEFICIDKESIIDYVTTSGTLGDPVTFALSNNDLDRLAYNEASSFTMAGCKKGDIIQLMTTIDRRFMAGLAYFLGARELGCGIIRVGNGIPELQWDTIQRVSPNVCIVVPSFLMKLIKYAEDNGIDYNNSSLKKAICIGEALRTPTGEYTTLGKKNIRKMA